MMYIFSPQEPKDPKLNFICSLFTSSPLACLLCNMNNNMIVYGKLKCVMYQYLPGLFFHHNDDQSRSLLLQNTKYIATTTKTNSIVQRAVVHTTADILLAAQFCPSSSAITVFDVNVIVIINNNVKCVNKLFFHRGRGYHIL